MSAKSRAFVLREGLTVCTKAEPQEKICSFKTGVSFAAFLQKKTRTVSVLVFLMNPNNKSYDNNSDNNRDYRLYI